MGYTTTFQGKINVVPPFNKKEREYLVAFNETRHCTREDEYFVGGEINGMNDPTVIHNNQPLAPQPGLYCQWIPKNGDAIGWDEGEKFYHADSWMLYLIQNFLKPNAVAKMLYRKRFSFLRGHQCSGIIKAQGEDSDDRWSLVVKNNEVFVKRSALPLEKVGTPELLMRYCFLSIGNKSKCDSCEDRYKCYTHSAKNGA